ncbi:MAG: Asp-tRNA(Asn)/Glu-tRNA(Gln) amidotransferase subunit GatC [Pseudomonadota bacterium]|nr:Asp-tRNA(Asn)/Glu-tRNA(Gln) amidotransferase subunit GatC [Pseudomonadota bacterium]MEC8315475.1 Asp-tRNA(Asn)/Glu-tRNA(Gln) amidotransferase subunit GatC [Pseudomonadota bacterium]|tara:strand:- start:578 stop:886 length:309 start_codon:yes stop_codon:yes gene_type:complete
MVSKVNQMTITKDTIRKISNLAKISIADQEVEKLESEISSIIRWVEALNEVDTENVAPMSNSLTGVLRMREDLVTDGNKVSDILSNSPVDDENFFVVPKVIE